VDYAVDRGKSRCGGIGYDPACWDSSWDSSDNPDLGATPWPVRQRAIFGRYDYTGPYVTDLNHGGNTFRGDGAFVVQQCRAAITCGDPVFAWMDDLTACATCAELGYAKALGKRVWIAGPAEFDDLWLLYLLADRVNFSLDGPESALHIMLTKITSDNTYDDEQCAT
jgi:hypothetical protein